MSTPKPGQIRCPTCLRSTPPAAFCTQCGSPIPASARTRPRGLDRDELDERVRRRPGDGPFRRGSPVGETPERVGYVPYEPEPEDALAVRPDEEPPRPATPPPSAGPDDTQRYRRPDAQVRSDPGTGQGWSPTPPGAAPGERATAVPPPDAANGARDDGDAEEAGPYEPDAYDETYDDRPYGDPEDAYAYPYAGAEDRRRGGGSGGALPIIGFVVLCVLALAVGAVLAGLLGGDEPVGQATPSPSAEESLEPSAAPSVVESAAPSEGTASATPEPQDGPVTFPDGAVYQVEPCGTYEFASDLSGCVEDGTTRDSGDVWILVVFDDAVGSDNLTLQLRSGGQTIDSQERQLGSVVNCADRCSGLIWGAIYQDLLPGEYELVLRRNGAFADSAAFTVQG